MAFIGLATLTAVARAPALVDPGVRRLRQRTNSSAPTTTHATGAPMAAPMLTLHDVPLQPLSHVHTPLPSVEPLPSHAPWPLHTTLPARHGHDAQLGPK
jgi:hypothetical protein